MPQVPGVNALVKVPCRVQSEDYSMVIIDSVHKDQ